LPDYRRGKLLDRFAFWSALLAAALILYQFIAGPLFVARHVKDFFFGVPGSFVLVQHASYLIPAAGVAVVFACLIVWYRREATRWMRIYFLLFTISCVVHTAFLWRWHFIGVHL